jgi:glycosyltransferase 2 family protein
VVFGSSLPAWVMRSGSLLLALFLVVLSVICVMYYRKAMSLRWVHRLVRRLPERYQADVEQIYHRFVDGLRIIARPKQLFASILLTVLVWGVTGLGIYSLFLFYNLSFPLVAAFTVLAITVLGVSLPAGPALLGNFQFSCIVALSILNLSQNDAFAFSMIYYAFGVGLSIFLGLLFSPFMGISLADIRRRMRFCNSCHSEQREG